MVKAKKSQELTLILKGFVMIRILLRALSHIDLLFQKVANNDRFYIQTDWIRSGLFLFPDVFLSWHKFDLPVLITAMKDQQTAQGL